MESSEVLVHVSDKPQSDKLVQQVQLVGLGRLRSVGAPGGRSACQPAAGLFCCKTLTRCACAQTL